MNNNNDTQMGSATSILSLLSERDQATVGFALEKLNKIVDVFWAEISEELPKLKELYNDSHFNYKPLVSLLISKIYYNLENYEEALNYALESGDLFKLEKLTEYVKTIKFKCLDKYQEYTNDKTRKMNPVLEDIVEELFNGCLERKDFKTAIGISIDSGRLDIYEKAINLVEDKEEFLDYIKCKLIFFIGETDFQKQLLKLLISSYEKLPEPNIISICECCMYLNDHEKCFKAISYLVESNIELSILKSYQISFNLYSYASQAFLEFTIQKIQDIIKNNLETKLDVVEKLNYFRNNISILSGEKPRELELEFLYRNNHSDPHILNITKSRLNPKSSLHHSALTFAHSIMQCGTTNDDFLRANIEFLSHASNWSKFSATAGFGMVHKGQTNSSMNLLAPYLPQEGITGSPYSEGGALFGLGIIHINNGSQIVEYLLTKLKMSPMEVIQNGACMGLAISGLGSKHMDVYESLKGILFSDSAIAGEAASIAMGAIMLGTGNTEIIDEMLQYAYETKHEKIVRGIVIGISLIMYKKGNDANIVIDMLLKDKNPIMRYGAMYSISMAYAGTGENKMIKQLLHVAVSDRSDDVRRAAVIAIGFLMIQQPKSLVKILELLAENFNPHVRYGTAIALGIGCSSSGNEDAVKLLEPLTKDLTDFVKQAALISLSMVLNLHNDEQTIQARKLFETIIENKHEFMITKFGAILAQGIIDAGGRNMGISLMHNDRSHYLNDMGIVGMALFTQFWYWFPMVHFISLALKPMGFIGIDQNLKIPKMKLISESKPSEFAYPSPIKNKLSGTPDKMKAAILSITAKTQTTNLKNDLSKNTIKDNNSKSHKEIQEESNTMVSEPTFQIITNLSRVTPKQMKFIKFMNDTRYVPVVKDLKMGFVILEDTNPTLAQEFIDDDQPVVN